MYTEQVKSNFENTVQRMQGDLKSYAGRPSSNPAAVQTRMTNINNLVEYYKMTEQRISELEMKLMESQIVYGRLHQDTQRLVVWCELHRVNPNMVFQFTLDELKYAYDEGVRIKPPGKDFNQMLIVPKGKGYDIQYQEVEDVVADDERVEPFVEKYYSLIANAFYARKIKS